MVEFNKQVRVENWGTFFLQRLQVFFAKTDYCDLTLQFDGNMQLKVHRLVMNACTEYFRLLEENCPSVEENTIIMPADLQSDVIVPIVNFMYTGMLEFQITLYDKIYKAAETMNMSILTKLLDAQKISQPLKSKSKIEKKQVPVKQPLQPAELPSPLPGRKLPVWKRKMTASTSTPQKIIGSPSMSFESKWHMQESSIDNTPKPTRFEWPEDDLPSMDLMDNSFEDISYTSRPLVTKDEVEKVKTNFDDLRYNVELPAPTKKAPTKSTDNAVNFKELEEFAKEQRIRSAMFEDADEQNDCHKRKSESSPTGKQVNKKIKINNKENNETTISVESTTSAEIDHTKIVTEILKKYPELVKKNKNIKLKIMSGNKDNSDKKIVNAVVEEVKRSQGQLEVEKPKPVYKNPNKRRQKIDSDTDEEGPWTCNKCISVGGEVQEFVLYYLYRKHMTDVHDEVFDSRLCKYCGRKCGSHNLMLYHMYTKHSLKPPGSYKFPNCDKCPYIAFNVARLKAHKYLHDPNEIQCQECKLAFTSPQTLSTHIRITGHYNKPGKISYDCQYCMKKLQSGITLLGHIRKAHYNESIRDGIVCLEELDALDELESEEIDDKCEELILSNAVSDNMQKEKVKILSNVSVTSSSKQRPDSTQNSQIVPIDSSAEALNNVASGIATSLNLVDIVVLDDNQQYILQQDGQSEQEFIIPNLAHGQPFTGQVITTQDNTVIQQGMIQSNTSDIASTDELVMVLTDQDYPDEHEGENPENSNIVVLYSHPVDGQEGQFITSQGNLMVNSQTGMLEIRNGSSITTTTASEMVVTNSVDSPIESIEMIQREIDSQAQNLKHDAIFEERKPDIQPKQRTTKLQSMPDLSEPEAQQIPFEPVAEECAEVEQLEETQIRLDHNLSRIEVLNECPEQTENKDTSEDNVDGNLNISNEEPMEIDDLQQKPNANENTEKNMNESTNVVTEETEPQTEGQDIPPEISTSHLLSEDIVSKTPPLISPNTEKPSLDEKSNEQVHESQEEGEPMEVDGKCNKNIAEQEIEKTRIGIDETDESVGVSENQSNENTEQVEKRVTPPKEIPSQKTEISNIPTKATKDINRTILDDWEDDTDSQQSEKIVESEEQATNEESKEQITQNAVTNVNKLMDDWDEEEEEERK